jgi:hypothetical protein
MPSAIAAGMMVAQHVKKVAMEPLIRLRFSVAKAFG